MRATKAFAAVCIAIASNTAFADVYGYVDADGMAHFSTEKLDDRYQLFMRGNGSFDSSQSGPAAADEKARPLSGNAQNSLSSHPNLQKFAQLVDEAAREFALEPALLKAVMAAESGFDPGAVSPKGAVGLMQIMPDTAERYGLKGDRKKTLAQKLADPKVNIRIAARYLRDLHNLFPSQPELVIASYNAGEGAVQKYKNTIPPYPETRRYVQSVKQLYQSYGPSAQNLSIARLSSDATAVKRIHLTIPGRRNMLAAAAEN